VRIKIPSEPNEPLLNGCDVIHDKEQWKLSADGRVLTEGDSDTKYVSVFDRVADPSVP
jgi:hypothetical protein